MIELSDFLSKAKVYNHYLLEEDDMANTTKLTKDFIRAGNKYKKSPTKENEKRFMALTRAYKEGQAIQEKERNQALFDQSQPSGPMSLEQLKQAYPHEYQTTQYSNMPGRAQSTPARPAIYNDTEGGAVNPELYQEYLNAVNDRRGVSRKATRRPSYAQVRTTPEGEVEIPYPGQQTHYPEEAVQENNAAYINAAYQGSQKPYPELAPYLGSQDSLEPETVLAPQTTLEAMIPGGAVTTPEEAARMQQARAERDASYGGLGQYNTGATREVARQGMNVINSLPVGAPAFRTTRGLLSGGLLPAGMKEGIKDARATRAGFKKIANKIAAGDKSKIPAPSIRNPAAGEAYRKGVANAQLNKNLAYGTRLAGAAGVAGLGLNLANNPQPQLAEFFADPLGGNAANLSAKQAAELVAQTATENPVIPAEAVQPQTPTDLSQFYPREGTPAPVLPAPQMQGLQDFYTMQNISNTAVNGFAPIGAPVVPSVVPRGPNPNTPTGSDRATAPGQPGPNARGTEIEAAAINVARLQDAANREQTVQQAYYQAPLNPFGSGSGYEDLQQQRKF